MKLRISLSGLRPGGSPKSGNGFTFTEILIALTVFLLLVVGIIAANLFGLRMFQANETKLNATQWSRNTFGKITDEIHSCNAVTVGSISNGYFVGLLPGEKQQGNALQIYPTTNITDYIVYFVNSSDQTFRRTTAQPGTAVILADSVTNNLVFSAQDFSGTVLTNNENNQVIHLKLEFYQPERFQQDPSYYKLETSVTRRALQ